MAGSHGKSTATASTGHDPEEITAVDLRFS